MSSEGAPDVSEMATEPGAVAMFGMLDLLVLGGVGAAAVWWFFLRQKQEDIPDIKKLTVNSGFQRANSESGFITKMKNANRNVVVFYGSQTGTAEEFAGRLAKDAARYRMKGMVADPEECEMEDLTQLPEIENSLAIFCMATYGEGDPTDNAQEFNDWLMETEVDLTGLKYAVFALGNKTYEHYNKTGKDVDKRLEELGAERIFELGLGDDDANIEEDFMSWREKFWPGVCEHYGIESTGEDINTRQYKMVEHEERPAKLFTGETTRVNSYKNQKPPYDMKNPFMSKVLVNRELHESGDRSCLHMEFDITGSKIRYDAGDHIAIFPTNEVDIVEALGQRLNIDLEQAFSLNNVDEDASKRHPFPCPTTFRIAFAHYLDICAPPRMNVLKELAEYCEDDEHKTFLTTMSSNTPEGKELYHSWIQNDCRNILTVLQDLPSLKPAVDHFCELMPRMQPRFYSISSSPKLNPTSIHVTAVVVDFKTPTGRQLKGVATSWLQTKQVTETESHLVPVYVRKSQFRLPFKPTVPVIMIGPGTGIAPFRGFIQDRQHVKNQGKPTGQMILYSGCRKQSEDYIYRSELEEYQTNGVITSLHMAFSRDQEHKVYVQHLLAKNAEETWKAIDGGGHLYVCGDAKHMAHDVDKALEQILVDEGKMPAQSAVDYLKRLRSKGRYSCDVWS